MIYKHQSNRGPLGKLWLSVVGGFFTAIERLRGASTVSEVFAPARISAKMVAKSIQGYELSVYCQRRHYQRIYDRFFVPDRHHVMYQITAVVSNDAPERLKKACAEVCLNISTSMHWTVDEDFQEQYVVQAYLDLLIEHLRRSEPQLQTA